MTPTTSQQPAAPRYRPAMPNPVLQQRSTPVQSATGSTTPATAPASTSTQQNSIYGSPNTSSSAATPNFSGDTFNNSNYLQDAQYAQQGGQQIENEAGSALNYYGSQVPGAESTVNSTIASRAATPGYTPAQAGQINTNYSQFNTPTSALQSEYLTPGEQQGVAGNTATAVEAAQTGQAGEGAMLNQYQANLGGELGAYNQNLSGQVSNYDTGVGGAVGNLDNGLSGASSGSSAITAAADNPGLQFDPNGTEKQITDAQVQQMATNAGQRIGAQYQTAQDQLQRSAAAAGNSSPLAVAAANSRLQTQEASDQGNAESNAAIQALQAQEQQASSIEGQREGAAQAQTGFGLNAATTNQAQAQQAAEFGGSEGLGAAEQEGAQGINAANTYGNAALNTANEYGQTSIGTEENIANQGYTAANNADVLNSQRAASIAGNRQSTDENINNTEYGQGVGSAQATAQGAATVGNAQLAGENTVLGAEQGQEGFNQQGATNSLQQQEGAYGTENQLIDNSVAAGGNFKNGSPTFAGQAGGLINSFTGGQGVFADGGLVSQPTIGIVGEAGPEMIVPVNPNPQPHDYDNLNKPRYRPAGQKGLLHPLLQKAMPTPGTGSEQGGGSTGGGWMPDQSNTSTAPPDDNATQESATDEPYSYGSMPGSVEPMAAGKLVTTPTVAMLGENGPEAVVPMNGAPGNHTGAGMLGAGGIRARYRHVQGPNAISRVRPIQNELPLKPNYAVR